MLQVVFVDDEAEVLDGLRRRLRVMRRDWNMVFLGSGLEALDYMQKEPVDVMVTDIRMPVMSGVELLLELKNEYPSVLRLALSGDAGSETELSCAQAAHQFIAKPADADVIQDVINRTSDLRKLLGNSQMQAVIGSIDTLPSLPDLYQRFISETNKKEGSIAKAAFVISDDVAMSAKILQLVNSSFFGIPRNIESVQQAATMLGLNTLKTLILSEKIFESSGEVEKSGLKLVAFAEHSQRIAGLARAIAVEFGLSRAEAENAFMAGSLRNVGKLVLASSFPDRYANVMVATDGGESFADAEIAEFGVSHSMAGAYLLGLWGLPSSIVNSVLRHFSFESECPNTLSSDVCLQVAVQIVNAERSGIPLADLHGALENLVSPSQLDVAIGLYEKTSN